MSTTYHTIAAVGIVLRVNKLEKVAKKLLKTEFPKTSRKLRVDRIQFFSAIDALAYLRYPENRKDLFSIEDNEAYANDEEGCIERLFGIPVAVAFIDENGEENVLVTAQREMVITNNIDDPYAAFHNNLPVGTVFAAYKALTQLMYRFEEIGLPAVELKFHSIRHYAE